MEFTNELLDLTGDVAETEREYDDWHRRYVDMGRIVDAKYADFQRREHALREALGVGVTLSWREYQKLKKELLQAVRDTTQTGR